MAKTVDRRRMMRVRGLIGLTLLGLSQAVLAKQDHTNLDEAKVGTYTLPPLLPQRRQAGRTARSGRRSAVPRSWSCIRITCTATRRRRCRGS